MSQSFDLIVIGAGPGGYIAAIRAAQLGMKVACIEMWRTPQGKPALGGTCLNVGCIPSKALLASSEKYEELNGHIADHGIGVGKVSLDLSTMMARKDAIVSKMTQGIEFLFRKNKIVWLKGQGRFAGRSEAGFEVDVVDGESTQRASAPQVIVATGSKARHLPGIAVDNQVILDNEGALAMSAVPKRLGVIGAGVIGLELGSVWRRLGSEVTILEAMPEFLAAVDEGVRKEVWKQFTGQGLSIHLGVRLGEVSVKKSGVKVAYQDAAGASQTLDCDRLIVSVGRVPNTDGLGLDQVDLTVDDRGFIPVDQSCRTAVPGIWAVGDVVRGPMLAHKAEDEGVMVAELIAGQKPHIDYNCIPWVIYTAPEIAWVGKTEKQLKDAGRPYKAGQFPFAANGRALGMGAAQGFVKVLADQETDEVLGVHIVAANASDLIAEAVMAMEFKASAEDIGRICHAHPSLSEALKEAALAASDKRALNA